MTDTPTAYPLKWPVGVPRTSALARKPASFGRRDVHGWKQNVTVAGARDRLDAQLVLLGVADTVVLSTNVQLNLNGAPRSGQGEPTDPGAAVYFTLKGKPIALPCDRWTRVADNITALAKHIEAMRGMDRWGVGSIEQAFAGYAALPAPEAAAHWSTVLGVSMDASLEEIRLAYRDGAREAGTDQGLLLKLNLARDAAVAARSLT